MVLRKMVGRNNIVFGVVIAIFGVVFLASMAWFLKAPRPEARQFTVARGISQQDAIQRLVESNYVRSSNVFRVFYALRGSREIVPGGYVIPEGTNAWELAGILAREPQMVWVTVPEGLRKEEIAEILNENFAWSEEDVSAFFHTPKLLGYPVQEGVYFPDTYLVDRIENGEKVAKRMINRFNEQLAPYQAELLRKNIKWDTAMKVASLVQREAAGESDMGIISAVIWNRLEIGMKLDIDATLQYALATQLSASGLLESSGLSESSGLPRASVEWWPPINREAKNIDSPYNTYRTRGLPPQPIANPGRAAIEAAIRPAQSRCLYYLHDTEGRIHCAVTYEEHQDNIERYLR